MQISSRKLATACYVSGIWVLGSLAIAVALDALRYIFGAMMYLDLSQWVWDMGLGKFIVGLLAWSFFLWVTVWCIATVYQALLGVASHE